MGTGPIRIRMRTLMMRRPTAPGMAAYAVLSLVLTVGPPVGRSRDGAGGVDSAPAPAAAGFLEVNAGRLYYEDFGSGFPLVLAHDGVAHGEVWDAQVADLARDYRVIRYDRRGYGRSDPPETTYADVDDLGAVLTGLGVARAVLIGSSAGGRLCLDYALAHPERVEALVLAGAPVEGLSWSLPFLERLVAYLGTAPEERLDFWDADPYAIAPGNEAARARLRELLTAFPNDLDLGRNRWARPAEGPTLPRLAEIGVPTLIVSADHDHPDVLAHAGALEAGIVGARRVLLEGVGHLCYLERPEAFDAEVREFLSLIGLGPGSPLARTAPPAPWDTFARGFAPVPGSALYHETMGAGEPVVLIHGGALDHRAWPREFADLAADHLVIRYDVRGHGLSRSPGGVYRSHEDLGRLLDHLGVERAHLVGLSLGARIAIDFALVHPERVISLAAVSPGLSGYPFATPEDQAYLQRIRAAWSAGDFAAAAEEFVRAWCDGPEREPEAVDPAVRGLVEAIALQTVRPDRDLGRGRDLEPPATERLAELSVPTLAILGELDMPSIHEIVGMIAEQVPGARRVVVPGVAHMVNLERPDDLAVILRDFLAENADR